MSFRRRPTRHAWTPRSGIARRRGVGCDYRAAADPGHLPGSDREEFKKDAVELVLSSPERPVADIARSLGVHKATLCSWAERELGRGRRVLTPHAKLSKYPCPHEYLYSRGGGGQARRLCP
ncbi:transposase [Streptomyces sp. NPDC001914]|uniref:transposase n=1 Tax=Streptomyces sp. NPDC001914 TaxID=3364623 RepID=UPI0036C7FC40